MAKKIRIANNLVTTCQTLFAEGGRLNTAIPQFVVREQQSTLAAAIAEAILKQTTLVIEAGTGTGKTFAYLVPALLQDKKVILSTATKTLQDQLIQKDLPLLLNALGIAKSVQILKGRSNYICHHRTHLFSEQGRMHTEECAQDIAYVRETLPQLTHGERSELPHLDENALAWPYVTSTQENCLGRNCEYLEECFLMKARKRAIAADVVVINHHVYFADSRLKAEGFGELLPQTGTVIFDEAHQLAGIAIEFQGKQIGTRQLRECFDDMLREWPVLDLVNQPFKQWSIHLDQILDHLCSPIAEGKYAWNEIQRQSLWQKNWAELLSFMEEWVSVALPVTESDSPGLSACKTRLLGLYELLHEFALTKTDHIHWLEKFKRSLVFHQTPIDVSESFQILLKGQPRAYIFTSATLTLSQSFAAFLEPLGLDHATTLYLASPFNFSEQALLYLPRSLPDPKNLLYYEALLHRALPIIEACQGRCFFLFTSHRGLQEMASLLKNKLKFPLLVQGEEAKPILLARFRELGNAVLLGTATFWEGVDVKGDTLSCVIIDKIPFPSPKDPVLQGKMNYLRAQGSSGFELLSLATAVLALKQGVGRLIRDADDRGVLMIADPRLTGRDYGEKIFTSLPPMRKTREEQTVLSFIERGFCE